MSTARKCLLSLLGDQFTPVMEGTIGDPQIKGHLGNALPARLPEAHRLLLKLLRKRSLVFRHLGFPFLTKYIPSSSTLSNRGKPRFSQEAGTFRFPIHKMLGSSWPL